jgi:serine/threonine protein kinase
MIHCIATEYHRSDFFHGDIKPENIFFHDLSDVGLSFSMTSDIGSLLHLGEANE